jgi:hypothetical protein
MCSPIEQLIRTAISYTEKIITLFLPKSLKKLIGARLHDEAPLRLEINEAYAELLGAANNIINQARAVKLIIGRGAGVEVNHFAAQDPINQYGEFVCGGGDWPWAGPGGKPSGDSWRLPQSRCV